MGTNCQLSDDLIEEYDVRGVVCLRNVFSSEWVETVKRGIDWNITHPGPLSLRLKVNDEPKEGAYFFDICSWQRIQEFHDFVFQSPVAEIAGKLMKSKTAIFYHEHVLNKEPGTMKLTPWHHDQPYHPIDGFQGCSIWMPVDPVPLETTLSFVKGSHRWGRWFVPREFDSAMNYTKLIEHDDGIDRPDDGDCKTYEDVPVDEIESGTHEIIRWALQPGDCIAFHMRTLHSAPGNTSTEQQRRVLSTRWLGDDAILARRPWSVSPPVFGGLKYGDRVMSEDFPLIWREE